MKKRFSKSQIFNLEECGFIALRCISLFDLYSVSICSQQSKANAKQAKTDLFMEHIEQFRLSKPEFYNQLIKVFNNDPSLTTLDLNDNEIGDDGAQALAIALENNTSITEFNLEYNQIGDEGAQALATALQKNNSLTVLNLGYNEIVDEGAQALATVLRNNISIMELNLGSNEIGDASAQALAIALQ